MKPYCLVLRISVLWAFPLVGSRSTGNAHHPVGDFLLVLTATLLLTRSAKWDRYVKGER